MKRIEYKIRLIRLNWFSCKSFDDKFFYFGPSWEGAFSTGQSKQRVDIYGTNLRIGKLSIMFGCLSEDLNK